MKIFYTLLLCFSIQLAMAQESCESAISVSEDVTITVDEVNGPTVPDTFCASGGDGASTSEWYTYTSMAGGLINITTSLSQNEGIDTRFHVYSGTCDNLTCIGGDDDSGDGFLSISTVMVDAEETIYIAFDDRWSNAGFDFILTETEPGDFPLFTPGLTGISGGARCVVDMNGDFLDDIVGVDGDDIIFQYQQDDGSFIEEIKTASGVTFSPSWSIAAGDIDGNGFNDLVYGNGTGVNFIYASDDGSEYSEYHTDEYVFCQRTNFTDINNDGHLDAFVCHDVQPNVYYLNDGEGNLTYYQGGLGETPNGGNYGSVWLDFDNDGKTDMFIAKCRGGVNPANINQMHRGDGNGNYIEIAGDIGLSDDLQTWSSAWADYDNDGDMDGYIGASSFENGPHKLMLNNGAGQFTDYTANTTLANYTDTGIENAPYDMDNDGYVDVVTNNGNILKNNGDLTFTAMPVPFGRAAVGDLDNDGFLDVLSNGSIYFNSGNGNNYIKINTVGTESNINGIGSRIEIESAMGTQIRDVRSGESFSVMSSLTTHFGLGLDDEITSVTITWPSGNVDLIENPAVNTTLTVVEGETVGINEIEASLISVYPNPCVDFISIENNEIPNGTLLSVFDQQGRNVMTQRMLQNRLDVSTLSTGSYHIIFNDNDQLFKVKFVKQ